MLPRPFAQRLRVPSVALAGALLCTALVGCGSDEADPAAVVAEWFRAYEVGDVEGFQSLMSSDATSVCEGCGYERAAVPYFGPGGASANDLTESRILALAGGTLEAACGADGDAVRCSTRRASDFGIDMATGETVFSYDFTVEDGAITHYTVTREQGDLYDFEQLQDYRLWLENAHPEHIDSLFAFTTILLSTDAQFELHQRFVAEYLGSRYARLRR